MQLELFMDSKEAKPAATIFRFPLARRTDLTRETAAQLHCRPFSAGKRYWAPHVTAIHKDLRSTGLSHAEAESEIKAYAQAVRREVFSSRPMRISQ